MVTMQTLYHDGGFSTMGISDALVEMMTAGAATATDEDAEG
jgi:enoyl-[acyl-carrier protein] reductase I